MMTVYSFKNFFVLLSLSLIQIYSSLAFFGGNDKNNEKFMIVKFFEIGVRVLLCEGYVNVTLNLI